MGGPMKFIIKYLPFAGIITINALAIAGRFRLESLKPYVLIISAIILLNLIIASKFKLISEKNRDFQKKGGTFNSECAT